MNKNTLIGSILMCLLFIGYVWVNQPTPEQLEQMRRERDSIAAQQREAIVDSVAQAELANLKANNETLNQLDSAAIAAADSIANVRLVQKYGNLAAAAKPQECTPEVITLKNNKLTVDIATRGGQISAVTLNSYDDYLGNPLQLFNAQNQQFFYTFYSIRGNYVTTEELYFQPVEVTDTTACMRLVSADGGVLDFVYRLNPDSYLVDYTIHTRGLDNIISPTQPSLSLTWNQRMPRTELGRDFEGRYSQLYYKYAGQSTNDLSSMSDDDESLDGRMTWVSYQNQFFSTMLVTNDLFNAGKITSLPIKEEDDENAIKLYKSELEFDIELKGEQVIPMCWYMGPKDYWVLSDMNDIVAKKVGKTNESLEMEDSFYLGWRFIVHYVNSWVIIPLFHFMDKFISNYGIIILLMTLFIKLVTLPMTYKSYKSSARMRIAQQLPEVQALNAKYPNQEDAMQKQQEIMALYSRMGVNQMGGCVPMLIQWPVLIALFYFFPTSIELRHQPFLWADDLSTYDAFFTWEADIPVIGWIFGHHLSLFCLLMTITNVFYTWLMQKQNPSQQAMPGMKAMMYFMPLMFLFFLNQYSAGLSYYYFLSTLFGIVITYAIKWSMDEKKILEELKYNLAHPKKAKASKSSGWIAKLQEMQRQQEEALRKQREEQAKRQRR